MTQYRFWSRFNLSYSAFFKKPVPFFFPLIICGHFLWEKQAKFSRKKLTNLSSRVLNLFSFSSLIVKNIHKRTKTSRWFRKFLSKPPPLKKRVAQEKKFCWSMTDGGQRWSVDGPVFHVPLYVSTISSENQMDFSVWGLLDEEKGRCANRQRAADCPRHGAGNRWSTNTERPTSKKAFGYLVITVARAPVNSNRPLVMRVLRQEGCASWIAAVFK